MSTHDAAFPLIVKLLLINGRGHFKMEEIYSFVCQKFVSLKPFGGDVCNFTDEETQTRGWGGGRGVEGTWPRAVIHQAQIPGVLGSKWGP